MASTSRATNEEDEDEEVIGLLSFRSNAPADEDAQPEFPPNSQLPPYRAPPSKAAAFIKHPAIVKFASHKYAPTITLTVLLFAITLLMPLPKWSSYRYPSSQSGYESAMSRLSYQDNQPFTPKEAEELFLTVPNNESCRDASNDYTYEPHLAGTYGDLRTALTVKNQWERNLNLFPTLPNQMIFDAGSRESKRLMTQKSRSPYVWIDTYYTLLNYPERQALTLEDSKSGKVLFNASLVEDYIELDPTAGNETARISTFHGYSKNGTASGPLIYANLGRKEDFEYLESKGISLKGAIVLVRYGGNFRGLKVSLAAEAGAVGCLIYTDPFEDGEITLVNGYQMYPVGPARQPSSVQRGSVQSISYYPGDPLTPGYPSYHDSKRLERNTTGLSLPTIPSLPISFRDALPFLEKLNHHNSPSPAEWKGALPGISYNIGPAPDVIVNLTNIVWEKLDTQIWNTYAMIPGHIQDEIVVLGNHRDAWVFGASDPSAGTSVVHEIVKGLGTLMAEGWKPLRSILVTSWDAEEYGLVGSTEFGEDYASWIQDHVVAYLNVDSATSGSALSVGASPSLAHMLQNITMSLFPEEAQRGSKAMAEGQFEKVSANSLMEVSEKFNVHPLGSGSDYTVMLQHLGIASSDMAFRRIRTDPVYHYHSVYDSQYWMDTFGDPGFKRHVQLAKILGLATLRLADSLILPLNISYYAKELENYVAAIPKLPGYNSVRGSSDLELDKLSEAIHNLWLAARHLEMDIHSVTEDLEIFTNPDSAKLSRQSPLYAHMMNTTVLSSCLAQVRSINYKLRTFERGFISPEGLHGREWYQHLGVAPGRWLGYGATTLPGITEAITLEKDAERAKEEVKRLTDLIKRMEGRLRKR